KNIEILVQTYPKFDYSKVYFCYTQTIRDVTKVTQAFKVSDFVIDLFDFSLYFQTEVFWSFRKLSTYTKTRGGFQDATSIEAGKKVD
ncbi:unnamed protein product, partial [Brachionus calyciflorus]